MSRSPHDDSDPYGVNSQGHTVGRGRSGDKHQRVVMTDLEAEIKRAEAKVRFMTKALLDPRYLECFGFDLLERHLQASVDRLKELTREQA